MNNWAQSDLVEAGDKQLGFKGPGGDERPAVRWNKQLGSKGHGWNVT